MYTTFSKRLRELMLKESINENALSKAVKIPQPTIHRILTGESKEPRSGNIEKLAVYFKTHRDSFYGFEQSQPKQRDYAIEDALSYKSVGQQVDIRRWIPLISWVQAGSWHEPIDNYQLGDGEDMLPCPVPCSDNTFALQVSGDSMADEYPEGYIIFVDPSIPPTHKSDVVVRILPENEVTFKRYMIDGGKPYLKAMNKDWPNPIIPINGDAEICGVVIFAGKYPQKS